MQPLIKNIFGYSLCKKEGNKFVLFLDEISTIVFDAKYDRLKILEEYNSVYFVVFCTMTGNFSAIDSRLKLDEAKKVLSLCNEKIRNCS